MYTRLATSSIATRSAGYATGAYPRVIAPPSGFGWSPSWRVIETAPGVFTTTLDPLTLRVSTASNRYVDIAAGSDANNGQTSGSPYKSIWKAVDDGNVTIYVKAGHYPYDSSWRNTVFPGNVNVIGVADFTTLAPGTVTSSIGLAAGDSLLGTWALTADGAGPHVYEATLAVAPYAVVDATVLTSAGIPTKLTSRASVALVEANPGSYYHDGSAKIYVRTADSRAPDTSLRPLKSAINGYLNTALSICVENVVFEGGNARAFYLQDCATASFINCDFTLSQQQGLDLNVGSGITNSTHTIYAINCRALGNLADGFGATILGSGESVRWAEINCTARANSGAGTDQGSSLHLAVGNTAVSGIRVNGTFVSNKTQGFADVGGTTTWAVGCRFSGEAIGAYVGDTGTGWLQGCTFVGCTTDLDPFDAGATINIADCVANTTAGSGTVGRYHP